MTLTQQRINKLIERRNKLTDRRDSLTDWDVVNLIDTQLAEVPPGQDNRVDKLLSRTCATLPERPDYGIAQAEQDRLISDMDDQSADFDAYMNALCAGLPDGIVKHDDWRAGAWK